jgi:nickel-dependent lactate racemase
MLAAARLARLRCIVNVALDHTLPPLRLAASDPEVAHSTLAGWIAGVHAIGVGPFDLIVTGPGRNLDINLHQSVKSLVAIKPLEDRETVILLVSACRERLGSDEMSRPF